MKKVAAATTAAVLLAAMAPGQERTPNPNNPEWIKSEKAPGLQVRFVDFKWDEAAFHALQTGADHPASRRSWVLARLMVQSPVRFNGKIIPVGSALLVLNPAKAGAESTLHIQYVDMREVFIDMNVIAEPPEGRVYNTVPAAFTKVETMAPRLVLTLREKDNAFEIGIHYGDRSTSVTLTRA